MADGEKSESSATWSSPGGGEDPANIYLRVGPSLLFFLLLVPISLGALWSYPTWDDGLFHFVARGGFEAVDPKTAKLGWKVRLGHFRELWQRGFAHANYGEP